MAFWKRSAEPPTPTPVSGLGVAVEHAVSNQVEKMLWLLENGQSDEAEARMRAVFSTVRSLRRKGASHG